MSITITAFAASPDRGRGLARDMTVRWALEELGLPYQVRLLSMAALKEPAHRTLNPFGQIPTLEEDGLVLFESGAIVLYLAERHAGLLPTDADARARAIMWMFAAHSSVEPVVVERSNTFLFEREQPWYTEHLAALDARVRQRLADLARRLADDCWLQGAFSAGDLLMVQVLRRLTSSGLLDEFPNLAAYVARGQERPAFQRAFAAQRAVFEAQPSPASA